MTGLACKLCGVPITFDNKLISQKTGKNIPLDPTTNESHDCPVRRDQPQQQGQIPPQDQPRQRRYLQCNKGCGEFILFHESQHTENRKWIPLDKNTGEPHQCQQ
jgi:hypothetical protein